MIIFCHSFAVVQDDGLSLFGDEAVLGQRVEGTIKRCASQIQHFRQRAHGDRQNHGLIFSEREQVVGKLEFGASRRQIPDLLIQKEEDYASWFGFAIILPKEKQHGTSAKKFACFSVF